MQPIQQIINYIDNEFNLNNENILGDEYFYSCLPLCLLDSVFSIGSHYASTENVINRYSEYYKIEKIRPNKNRFPCSEVQHTLSEFIITLKKTEQQTLQL